MAGRVNPEVMRYLRTLDNRPKAENTRPHSYETQLADQGGTCAICGREPTEARKLARDHCHATGLSRGLLCGRCNTALGLFDDDVDRLIEASWYVELWASAHAGVLEAGRKNART